MSLRLKVNLTFALLLLASLLIGTGVLISNARQSVKMEAEDAMMSAARLIMISLGTTRNRNISVYEHLQELITELSEIRSLNILLFGTEGLLFEGEPKAVSVMPPTWFQNLLLPDVAPLSKRFGNGRMVIYSSPIHTISERWLDIRSILILGVLVFISVGLFLYWGVGRLLRPLEQILSALAGFERGNLHLRLPRFSLREMDRISQMFNRMGQTLESSIEENRRLAVLVQQSGDAILSLDKNGCISFFNYAAEQLFSQYSSNHLLGKKLADLGFADHRQKIADIVENFNAVDNLEVALMQDDSAVSLLFSTVPLIDSHEIVQGLICTLRDITKHKQAEIAETKLRESRLLAKHIAEVQDNERRYLAQELHDELGQCLTAIKTDAVLIRNRTKGSESTVFSSAQAIIDAASHIYDVVHNMINRLRPSPLDDLGLLSTLEQSVERWRQRQPNIKFKLSVTGSLDNFNEVINMTVFRIVQESVTNAVRHAFASQISISIANKAISGDNRELVIDICDNGKGMQVSDFHSDVDFGLLGMRERTHSLGGQFQLESSPGKGFAIHVTLPLKERMV